MEGNSSDNTETYSLFSAGALEQVFPADIQIGDGDTFEEPQFLSNDLIMLLDSCQDPSPTNAGKPAQKQDTFSDSEK